jgi:hypothetical protein
MKDEYKAVGSWSTLGLEIVLSIMFGFFGGRWLDGKFGTDPYLAVAGFFFGCGAAGKAIYRTWSEMQKVTKREESLEGNPAPLYEKPEHREEANEESAEASQEPDANPRNEGDERPR